MNIIVKNGERVVVAFTRAGRAGYNGLAAIDRQEDGSMRLLFPARLSDVRGVTSGTVDGQEVSVVKTSVSALVPSLVEIVAKPE